MKNILILIAILAWPCTAWADVAQAPPTTAPTEAVEKLSFEKTGFVQYLASRKWAKRIVRMAEKRKEGDGRGFAVAGLVLALVLTTSWILSPLTGLLATIPLALPGFIFSLIGLRKSRAWQNVKKTRSLAILGLIINGAFLLFVIGLLLVATATLGQH